MSTANVSLTERLSLRQYDPAECEAALRGEKIPHGLFFQVNRLCVIRGIRCYEGFGEELRGLSNHPEFTRALNARSIMSNKIPDMASAEEIPYCIWYPEVASEETYRRLVHRYTQLKYQVGRACAVAGYFDLYRELQLLPDVSIAEEARDNKDNSSASAIFDEIMAQPFKYAVMDDYTRSVNTKNPRPNAHLNGDTAVQSLLEAKHKFKRPAMVILQEREDNFDYQIAMSMEAKGTYYGSRLQDHYFNITEDYNIGDSDSKLPDNDEVESLLYWPLPVDLPPVNKDLLILCAAYSGNIDRYARLRRPEMLDAESACVVRGIYHDTMFAKWWSLQPELARGISFPMAIRKAINARFVMNNDLSRITEDVSDNDLPYLIWYPNWADDSTYEELARRRPSMKAQAARACIVADYQLAYDRIKPIPDFFLVQEAKASQNPHYLEDLLRRAAEMHIDISEEPNFEFWRTDIAKKKNIFGRRDIEAIWDTLTPPKFNYDQQYLYNGIGVNMSAIETFVCLPDEIRMRSQGGLIDLRAIYLQMCRPYERHVPMGSRGRGGSGRGRGRGGR